MITLCMDTSHQFLVLTLLRDEQWLAGISLSCWKKQSEMIFLQLNELLKQCGLKPKEIGQVVVTCGPGSYTGVRIAMTIAKVICATANLPLYSLPTMELIGAGIERAAVVLDARSHRAYLGLLENGRLIEKEQVLPLEQIQARLSDGVQRQLLGDLSLLGQPDFYPDLSRSFLLSRPRWQRVENVHLLVPEYMKSADEYLVKKG